MGQAFESSNQHEFNAGIEQVWQAVATGPGLDSWFLGTTTIDPHVGGDVSTRMGDVTMDSTVTAWDPPRRFAFRGGEDDNGRFQAYEFLVEGREGGSTVLRLITSGYLPGDDWEDELEAMSLGGDMFFATLIAYITFFPGRTATPVLAAGPAVGDFDHALTILGGALGLTQPAQTGAAVSFDAPSATRFEAVVDFSSRHAIGLRSDSGLYRFVRGFHNGSVIAMHHLFDEPHGRTAAEHAWQSWLNNLFR
jgi:uncharacterized protein YndB with AHSA1/START domain